MRGDQLSRQWRILRQIETSKYGLTATEIAELGGVSLKTGYRDLNDLQLAGFPLYAETGKSGQRWKFIDTYRFKLPQPFTFTELMSLHMSRDLFKVFKGTAFYESMQSLFEKVRATLHPRQTSPRRCTDDDKQNAAKKKMDSHQYPDCPCPRNRPLTEDEEAEQNREHSAKEYPNPSLLGPYPERQDNFRNPISEKVDSQDNRQHPQSEKGLEKHQQSCQRRQEP